VVYVGLPNAHERREILKVQRAKMPWHSHVNLDRLVETTERANAASLVALCQAAAIQAMQREASTDNAALEKVSANAWS
jgi:ATP-dependent 26S proteasome regulatory subunit